MSKCKTECDCCSWEGEKVIPHFIGFNLSRSLKLSTGALVRVPFWDQRGIKGYITSVSLITAVVKDCYGPQRIVSFSKGGDL